MHRSGAVADELRIDMRAACLGMLEALEDDETGTFAHDEAAAVLVERARCVLRIIVVVHAERLHRSEACDSRLADGCFRATGNHDIGLAFLDDAEGVADAVRARRASRDDARGRTVELIGDGDLAGSKVRDHHRDEERRDAARSLVEKLLVLGMHRLDAADAGTDVRADAVRFSFSRSSLASSIASLAAATANWA